MVELEINGKIIQTKEGTTILEAAKAAGIDIPSLCYDKRLLPYGACRVCLVEVEGMRGLVTACSTPVAPSMKVKTNTPAVTKARKTVLELILVNHPLDCPVCDKAGECKLQDLVYEYGVKEGRFTDVRFCKPLDDLNPFIRRNLNRCILCGRCARMCEEVQGVGAISFINRGFNSKISTSFEEPLSCEFCGNCITSCPVGALSPQIKKIKPRTWQVKKVPTTCTYCGCGCQLELNVFENEIVNITTNVDKGINEGNLCVKGSFGYDFVNHPDRLKKPLLREGDSFREISWDEALDEASRRLSQIKEKYGADAIAGLSSAKGTNEENYLFQKFMREAIGTNNVDHCARL